MSSKIMSKIINFFKNPWFLYLLLLLPSINIWIKLYPFMSSYFVNDTTLNTTFNGVTEQAFKHLSHSSGELSIRLLLLTLLISPLQLIFSRTKIKSTFLPALFKWLRARKRVFGVYTFYYTILHLLGYLIYKNYDTVISDLSETTYLAGWLAFGLMLPLFFTSTNYAVKKLGGIKWKKLHRLVYILAILTAIHWLTKEKNHIAPVIIHFLPLILLEGYRFYLTKKNPRKN